SHSEKFKMSMTMTMGMEHTGVAGREMTRLMELDIRQKFFLALILSPANHSLFASREIHLRLSAASPYTGSLDSLPTNNSRILLFGLDFPLLQLQSSPTSNTKHVSSH